ncbi:MAG: hypothetical protein LBL96_04555 [Clostridiales bacterium]|nr:hypothetical protein [Clostridiales bacterium]
MNIDITSGARGGTVTAYADRPNAQQGTRLGTFTVPPNAGEAARLSMTSADLNALNGKHDIFFAFTPAGAGNTSMCEFNYLEFSLVDEGTYIDANPAKRISLKLRNVYQLM